MGRTLSALGPPVASAALLAAAFPPANMMLLVLVALVPLFGRLQAVTPRKGLWSGVVFGAAYMAYQMFFLVPFVRQWTGSALLAAVPWVVAVLIGMWYFGLLGWLVSLCFKLDVPWLIPLVWAGIEVLRSYIPMLAFPWGLLASPLWQVPEIVQHASLGTIYFVGAWVVVCNLMVLNIIQRASARQTAGYGLVFILLMFFSLYRFNRAPTGRKVLVTAAQPGVDVAFTDPEQAWKDLRAACTELLGYAMARRSKLVIFPEGLARDTGGPMPRPPFELDPAIPVLYGGRRGTAPTYQSAFSFDGAFRFIDKSRLVVFGEYVPFRKYLPFLQRFNLPGGDLTPGESPRPIEVAGLKAGPLLCFEALFPDVAYAQERQGAQFLATMAIDDWYAGTPAPAQLLGATAWRAIESGLPAVRSAMTGVTAIFDARGRPIAIAPQGKTTSLSAQLTLAPSDAFVGRWWFVWMAAASMLAPPALALYRRRRPTDSEKPGAAGQT